MEIEVAHRDVSIFGHHQIQADYARVSAGHFKARQNLCEDLFGRKAAQDLVKIADRHLATWIGLRGVAMQRFIGLGVGGIELLAAGGNHIGHTPG